MMICDANRGSFGPRPPLLPAAALLVALLAGGCGPAGEEERAAEVKVVNRNFKEICYSLRPLLVPREEVRPGWVSRPFTAGLSTTYVVDMVDRMKAVTDKHLEVWEVDADRVHLEARASFIAMFHSRLHELRFRGTKRQDRTVVVHPDQDVFAHSSLLLVPELYRQSLGDIFGTWEKLLVAIPSRNRCFFLRTGDPVTRNRLRDELIKEHNRSTHPLLDRYLVMDQEGRFTPGPEF
jgi:hypothetical protein